MPEGADPATSVGFLVAAAATTVMALAGYAVWLLRRLAASRARNAELRGRSEGTEERGASR